MTSKTQETMNPLCPKCNQSEYVSRLATCLWYCENCEYQWLGKQPEAQPQQEGEEDVTISLKVNKSTDYHCVTPENWQSLQSQLTTLTAENAKLKEKWENQRHTIEQFQTGLSQLLLNSDYGVSFWSNAETKLREKFEENAKLKEQLKAKEEDTKLNREYLLQHREQLKSENAKLWNALEEAVTTIKEAMPAFINGEDEKKMKLYHLYHSLRELLKSNILAK